jgi:hypothetical protein
MAQPKHTFIAHYCPFPVDFDCCFVTPDVADNPSAPAGYRLMMQSEVTTEMTTWQYEVLDDPVTYPMFSSATKTFGALLVLAQVEWCPPDSLHNAVHRCVTLYEHP